MRSNPASGTATAIPVSFAYGAFELKAGDKADSGHRPRRRSHVRAEKGAPGG